MVLEKNYIFNSKRISASSPIEKFNIIKIVKHIKKISFKYINCKDFIPAIISIEYYNYKFEYSIEEFQKNFASKTKYTKLYVLVSTYNENYKVEFFVAPDKIFLKICSNHLTEVEIDDIQQQLSAYITEILKEAKKIEQKYIDSNDAIDLMIGKVLTLPIINEDGGVIKKYNAKTFDMDNKEKLSNSLILNEEKSKKSKGEIKLYESRKIKIGNNKELKNSIIAKNINRNAGKKKKSFCEEHLMISSISIAVLAGIILKFSIWDEIINYITNLF